VFEKSYTGNILRIGRNKSQSSYFSRSVTESKVETEGSQEAATPPHGAVHPQVALGAGVGPWSTFWRRPSTYIFPLTGKPKKTQSIFLETYCKPPSSSMRDREGPEALPGTLSERGITVGGLLHQHACLRSDVWVVYLGLRVHTLLEKWLPAVHQKWLPVAHYRCVAGTTPLVPDYPQRMAGALRVIYLPVAHQPMRCG
jgi:hypothetical protein